MIDDLQTAPDAMNAASTASVASTASEAIEVSVVMPCLNEAETIAACIRRAQEVLRDRRIAGEVIVADNGSTDGSPVIARGLGARVITVQARGYGINQFALNSIPYVVTILALVVLGKKRAADAPEGLQKVFEATATG